MSDNRDKSRIESDIKFMQNLYKAVIAKDEPAVIGKVSPDMAYFINLVGKEVFLSAITDGILDLISKKIERDQSSLKEFE